MALALDAFSGRTRSTVVAPAVGPERSGAQPLLVRGERRHHRPTTAWARALLLRLHRWVPERLLVAVMDGAGRGCITSPSV